MPLEVATVMVTSLTIGGPPGRSTVVSEIPHSAAPDERINTAAMKRPKALATVRRRIGSKLMADSLVMR